jgi:hypothetical protein
MQQALLREGRTKADGAGAFGGVDTDGAASFGPAAIRRSAHPTAASLYQNDNRCEHASIIPARPSFDADAAHMGGVATELDHCLAIFTRDSQLATISGVSESAT